MDLTTTYIVLLFQETIVKAGELCFVIILNHKSPGASLGCWAEADPRPEVSLEFLKRGAGVGVEAGLRESHGSARAARREPLNLPNGQAAAGSALRQGDADCRIVNREQRAAVTGCDVPVLEEVLKRFLQLEQTQGVGHCCAVFAGAIGHVLLRQLEFTHKTLKGARLLNGVEVFALDVLNERDLQCLGLGNLADDGRDAREASALSGSPAALAGNQLIASLVPS